LTILSSEEEGGVDAKPLAEKTDEFEADEPEERTLPAPPNAI
jgi:hypothetical protein